MLDKHFDFVNKEAEISKRWEKAGVNRLDAGMPEQRKNSPVYNNVLPPPNANGELHIGHCYGYSVMDMVGRYRRMKGERVMLLPGKDHAGIQTQVVFERKLRAEGVEVEKMSRDDFWKSCYEFCMDRAGYMRGQEKLMGTSADFEREVFTLDPRVSEVVYDTFERMWKDGLVYRGTRIVNWSVYSQTSISDVEVEYKEEKGHLWHIEYPMVQKVEKPERRKKQLADFPNWKMVKNAGNHWVILAKENNDVKIGEVLIKIHQEGEISIERDYVVFAVNCFSAGKYKEEEVSKYSEAIREEMKKQTGEFCLIELVPDLDRNDAVIVATTRPETMLGDSAVAVHPADPRYTHLVGNKVIIPIIGREIAIIADDRIDIGFGTGAVKITPAHDFLDYQIGLDHKLEQIQVINKFGKMTEAAGVKYTDLKILDCRALVVKDLEETGKLLLVEEIVHKVPISERGKDVVEPLISTQWFVNVDKEGMSLKKRTLDLVNSGRLKVYPARMKNLIVQWLENLNDWNISRQILWGHRMPVWYRNKDQSNEQIEVSVDQPSGDGWVQETDTFDTWFSSGQWPYSTLAAEGLIDLNNVENNDFFPTNTMIMGRDLVLFWACRMLLFSAYRFNDVPWKNLYFTGLVRDAKGQKMSKSKGNGVEPIEMLRKYGADALRIGLIAGTSAGLDPRFDEKKVETYTKFINKIWNAAKLIEMKVGGKFDRELPSLEDWKMDSSKWIWQELQKTQLSYLKNMDRYDLSVAFEEIYHFAWDTFCSWYLEISKGQTESEYGEEVKAVMVASFRGILQMLHPFMPFFTEEIYSQMGNCGAKEMLAQSVFTEVNETAADQVNLAFEEMKKVQSAVTAAREVRKVLGKGFGDKIQMGFQFSINTEAAEIIEKMANVERVSLTTEEAIILPCQAGIMMIKATVDEKKSFKTNLEKTWTKKKQELEVLERILTPGFKLKADADLVAEREAQHQTLKIEFEALERELAAN